MSTSASAQQHPLLSLLGNLPEIGLSTLSTILDVGRSSLPQLSVTITEQGLDVLHLGSRAWLLPRYVVQDLANLYASHKQMVAPGKSQVEHAFEEKQRLRREWEKCKEEKAERPVKRKKFNDFQEALVQLNDAQHALKVHEAYAQHHLGPEYERLFRSFRLLWDTSSRTFSSTWIASVTANGRPYGSRPAMQQSPTHSQFSTDAPARGGPLSRRSSRGVPWIVPQRRASVGSGAIAWPPKSQRYKAQKGLRYTASQLKSLGQTQPIKEEPDNGESADGSAADASSPNSPPAMDINPETTTPGSASADGSDTDAAVRARRASFPGFGESNKVIYLPAAEEPKPGLLPHRRIASQDHSANELGY